MAIAGDEGGGFHVSLVDIVCLTVLYPRTYLDLLILSRPLRQSSGLLLSVGTALQSIVIGGIHRMQYT